MKIYILHYDSHGNELCGEYFSTKKKARKYIIRLVENYSWNKSYFKIEEIKVR